MSRLIDADALMERKQEEHGYYDITDSEFEELVKTQPTAYDLEKVVGEIRNQPFGNYGVQEENEIIDIVKRGGAE